MEEAKNSNNDGAPAGSGHKIWQVALIVALAAVVALAGAGAYVGWQRQHSLYYPNNGGTSTAYTCGKPYLEGGAGMPGRLVKQGQAPAMPKADILPSKTDMLSDSASVYLFLGTCAKGARVAVSPAATTVLTNVIRAKDGGIHLIAVNIDTAFTIKAWSLDGQYLGQLVWPPTS